jgi:6-phosphogluconolactonase
VSVILSSSTKPSPSSNLLVVALAGEGALALCRLNPLTGVMVLIEKVTLPGVEGTCGGVPMAANHARDKFYVAWRGEPMRLFSFALDSHRGRLQFLGEADLPASACYASMASSGRRLLTSSYTQGRITISPVDVDGKAADPVMVEDAAYPHCIIEAPNKLVYTTSLKGDFIQIYRFDYERNNLIPTIRQFAPSGSGPRHIVFSADGCKAFLVSEFSGTVTRFDVAPGAGALTPRQTYELIPMGEKAWAAEIRLNPRGDFLYVSERKTSQIFGFRFLSNGDMELVCNVSAPDCPRAFDFDSAGDYLIALGEKSGKARTYRIAQNGGLEAVADLQVGAGPSWVVAAA